MLKHKNIKSDLLAATAEDISLSIAASLPLSINLLPVYRPVVMEKQTNVDFNETGSDNKIFVITTKPAIEKPTIIPEEKIRAINLFKNSPFKNYTKFSCGVKNLALL
jgi:predicted metalloprotease with PDZ domain